MLRPRHSCALPSPTLRTGAELLAAWGLTLCSLASCAGPACAPPDADELRIGMIADCQYADRDPAGERRYRDSTAKLRDCVADLADEPLAFAVHLGDFIDRGWESFDAVQPVYAALPFPAHHVLGNHDFEVADARKAEVPERLGMPSRYYDFTRTGWRFVILDGNDLSLHAWPAGSSAWRGSAAYHLEKVPDAPTWNGGIGPQQLAWLEATLARADAAGERAVLLCHFPTLPEDRHSLWNAEEVLELLGRHPSVQAWIHGHDHAGGHQLRDGVHHLNLKGMVNTEQTAYAVLRFTAAAIEVDGRGREPDRLLPLRD